MVAQFWKSEHAAAFRDSFAYVIRTQRLPLAHIPPRQHSCPVHTLRLLRIVDDR